MTEDPMKKMLPARTLLALVLMISALAVRLPARGGGPPAPVPTDQPGSCAMMPAGLVGCWTGDGTPTDSAGALGGSWEGTEAYGPGLHGRAFSFDGQSSVVVASQPSLQFTSAFTLSAWINPSVLMSDPAYGGIISKVGGSGGNNGYQFALVGNNTLAVAQFNGAGQAWPTNVVSATLANPVPVNQWSHLAATYDQQTLRLYLNGALIASQAVGPLTIATSSSRFRISGDDNNNVRFKGLMDEVAVFNRALSDVEVSGLAQAPLRITSPTSLPNAALQQPYSQTVLAAGGVAPYFFSLKSGALPAGLSLSGDGVISGTTAMPGTYNFSVRVDDSAAHDNEMAYTIAVLAPGVAPRMSVTSDGRLGQASQYFFDNYAVNYYINTDNGVIYQQYSNYPWDPYPNQPDSRVISQPNGPDIRVLDFTSFDVNLGGSSLTIVGSQPLIIATQGDVSIRGNIRVLNNGGVGGSRPEGNYDLGISGSSSPGSFFANAGGGGWGAAFVFNAPTPWGWDIMTAASGGGGGSATMGANGGAAHTESGTSVGPHDPPYPVPGDSGAGGQASTADVFQGGGGGGQGGYAHTWYCCYTGGVGANGGGALMFQSGGNVLINANSSIVADGLPTPYYQGEVGGGGAGGGGYLLFDAAGTFENRGLLSSRGGAGTAYTTLMSGTPGAGGRVVIRHATAAANSGIIDVNGGDESATLGGEFIPSGIPVGGTIKGVGTNVLVGALTATGSSVIATSGFGTVTFPTVSATGTTNITPIDSAVAQTGGPLPLHYTDTGIAFDVTTTATYSAPVTSCFFAPSITTQSLFDRLRVLHLENGAFVDRTILAPAQPAPSFATNTICSSTSSLSPFILALIDQAPQHDWHADYTMAWQGVRSQGDAILDAQYQFTYGWRFGMFNDNIAPLDAPTISVQSSLAGLQPFAIAPQGVTYANGTWTGPTLAVASQPDNALFTQYNSNVGVPGLQSLGYDVTRELVGGRTVAAGATENRTYTVSFTTHDPSINRMDVNVDFFNMQAPQGGPLPVSASGVSCAGPGRVNAADGQPVNWEVGAMPRTVGVDPLQSNVTYTLSCTVTLTNSSAAPAMFAPGMVVGGSRDTSADLSAPPVVYDSLDPIVTPADPLGTTTFSTSATDTQAYRDVHFAREVSFDSQNNIIDTVPPTTTWSLPPSVNGWYNAPSVPVNLTATDPAPSSGFKRMSYTLSGAQNGSNTLFGPNAGLQITAEGVTTVTVQSEDNAGNIEAPQSFVVNIDRQAPVSSHTTSIPPSPQGWFSGPVTVTMSGTDNGSGVQSITYTVTPAGQQGGMPVVVAGSTATVTINGASSLNYFATDNAGNVEPNHAVQINIDSAVPSANVFASPGPAVVSGGQSWWNTNPTVNINASDNCNPGPCSGVKQVWYSLSGAQNAGLTAVAGLSATVVVSAEGTTTVTYYAEDNAGNTSAPASFVVNLDKTAPAVILNAPASMLEGQTITLSTAVTDVSNTLTYQWTPPDNGGLLTVNGASATYLRRQPGTVTIAVKVSDGHGNSTTQSATIQVTNVAPAVNVPGPATVLVGDAVSAPASFSDPGNDGPWVAQVSYGDGTPVQALPITMNPDGRSGSFTLAHAFMAPGDFTVTVAVTDNFGGTGTNTIQVHVDAPDTTPPTLSVQDITVTATDPGGMPVDYTVTATDDRGAATVACSPTSGSTFAIGATTVSCTATDAAGNSATATFTVTVRDGVPPVIAAPSVGTIEATSAAGATATFAPTATDNIGVTSVTCLPASGSTFAIGTTPVTCAAHDAEGNTATATFSVTVADSTSPALTVPTIVTATITSGTSVIVNYTATASDVVDGAIAPICTPATGTAFALGSTLVSCTATDAHGNTATATFTVKVNDGIAPVVTVTPAGDRTVEATSPAGAAVAFSAIATDNIDTALTTTCAPASGSTFPLGPTMVTCSATDASGNIGTASFTVTVVDTTAPALTLPAPPSVVTTEPSGAVVNFTATAADLVAGVRTVTCAPASGSVFAPGPTTVNCNAVDTRGNIATGSFVVTVSFSEGRLNRFVALSNDHTWLKQGVRVVSGDVGAMNRSGDVTVRLNEGVTMVGAGSRVVGDTVELMNKASVDNVIDNVLINTGARIRGSVTSPMALPFVAGPAFPQITAGTISVNVAKGKSQILAPGAWGAVHVSQGATLILSGGLYQVQSLDVDPQGTVLFRGATELRVAGELSAGPKAQLILDQTVAGLKASDMRIYVAGADTVCQHGALTEDGVIYGPAAVHIGPQGVVQANIYAPNGTVWLQAKTQATGAFIGARVRIGQGATLTLDSAWR
jgi:hypothetical protein